MSYLPGQRIKFTEEKQSYKIMAASDRFLICTKPFNAIKSYLYTIVDLVEEVRGPDDRVFGPMYDYNDPHEAQKGLDAFTKGVRYDVKVINTDSLEISHRRRIDLNIDWVK